MNLDMLKKSDRIIFECVAGSHLYNLNIPGKSDVDIRGIYLNPPTEYLGLSDPVNQVGDEKNDTTYYSLKRFFELAMNANPNILELLFVPENCIRICKPVMKALIENRNLFISKKCFNTFSGYSFAQIKKCRGQNKMVNHPEMFIKPKKEDFCWVIDMAEIHNLSLSHQKSLCQDLLHSRFINPYKFPFRPIPLKDHVINLSEFHVSSLEHVSNTFRLYYYGDKSKGVFRGDQMLSCESIPKEDEKTRFRGLLIYNENEYEKALIEHRKYCEWISTRNESRWVDQEKGMLTYDQKNMLHCMRLLMSGENILRHGFPLVRFEGEQREYLMKIRRGDFQYEVLMAEVEKRMADLEELHKTSTIPHSVNVNQIDELYRELSK